MGYTWEVIWRCEGLPTLRFVAAYGFRNIQAILRKIKSQRDIIHFAEVMACPSGCLNGGGQINGLLKSASALYTSHYVTVRQPPEVPFVTTIYGGNLLDRPCGPWAREWLHTS